MEQKKEFPPMSLEERDQIRNDLRVFGMSFTILRMVAEVKGSVISAQAIDDSLEAMADLDQELTKLSDPNDQECLAKVDRLIERLRELTELHQQLSGKVVGEA